MGNAINTMSQVEKYLNGMRRIIIELQLDPALPDKNEYDKIIQRWCILRDKARRERGSSAYRFVDMMRRLEFFPDIVNKKDAKTQAMWDTFMHRVDSGKY